MPEPAASSPLPPARHDAGVGVPGAVRRRHPIRLAMYLAFSVLAVAVVLLGLGALRMEALRAADSDILDRAGQQRSFVQQVGRLAAQIGLARDGTERETHLLALSDLIELSRVDALTMEHALGTQFESSAALRERAAVSLDGWQAAREKLWYRAQALLFSAEIGAVEVLPQGVADVQAAASPAAVAAQQLSAALHDVAQQRAQRFSRNVYWGVGGLLALLVLLSLAVVEPASRAVRLHSRRLREQAAELQRLALVAEHTSALVLITDAQDRITWVNSAFTRTTGWPLQDVEGHPPDRLLAHPLADEASLARMLQAVRDGQGLRQEWLHRSRDDRDLWLDVDMRALQDAEGATTGFVRVCTDTSLRVQQQLKLRTLWAALPAGVLVADAQATVVEVNREAERLLGVDPGGLHGLALAGISGGVLRGDGSAYPQAELPVMRTLHSGEAVQGETLGVPLADGRTRWLLVNTQPLRDLAGQLSGAVVCFSDISESRALQDRLRSMARVDTLTKLPNRAVVMERLQQAIDHARRSQGYGFAVLFMDFDRFKQINDTMGHGAGDELLRQIAQRLQRALRPGDAVARLEQGDGMGLDAPMAARLGGDEFVVVLDGVNDIVRAQAVAQRLLDDLAVPYTLNHLPVQSSVSIGLVLCNGLHGQGPEAQSADAVAEEVLRNADTAMYEAKRAGRGRYVIFDHSMHERVVHALAVEGDLRQALKENQLFVVYQPVVDLAERNLVGVEALVRWRHPQRGLVPPVEFVPIAEECGLIDALGGFVLQTACRQFMAWRHTLGAAGPSQLAVNMSRAQLQRSGIVTEVAALLKAHGMAPAQLQLEVTESLAAQDERVQATLRELKALGVRLALDDFGTGYSSLACLHQMPVDTVKVDRSFVKHAETVEYHRVLIEATIRVARTMGMSTVAEGIETEGQAALMRTLTCDRGQGYLFSRPLEAADLEAWARAQALARLPVAEGAAV